MIDNLQSQRILEILENLKDESLAVQLLKEFNDKTAKLGKLTLNLDPNLSSAEWKKLCDQAKKEVDEIVAKIESMS